MEQFDVESNLFSPVRGPAAYQSIVEEPAIAAVNFDEPVPVVNALNGAGSRRSRRSRGSYEREKRRIELKLENERSQLEAEKRKMEVHMIDVEMKKKDLEMMAELQLLQLDDEYETDSSPSQLGAGIKEERTMGWVNGVKTEYGSPPRPFEGPQDQLEAPIQHPANFQFQPRPQTSISAPFPRAQPLNPQAAQFIPPPRVSPNYAQPHVSPQPQTYVQFAPPSQPYPRAQFVPTSAPTHCQDPPSPHDYMNGIELGRAPRLPTPGNCASSVQVQRRDWIDSIDTPEEAHERNQRLRAQQGTIPILMSGVQDCLLEKFNGDAVAWQEWNLDFKVRVHDCLALSRDQRFALLKKSLGEEPRRMIFGFLIDSQNYKDALLELRKHYGSPEVVVKAQMTRISNLETLTNTSGISKFRSEVMKIIFNFSKADLQGDLNGHALLQLLVTKIGPGMRESWGNYVRKNGPASLHLLYEWLSMREEALRLGGGSYCEHVSAPEPRTEKSKRKSVNILPAKPNPPKHTSSDTHDRGSNSTHNKVSGVCVYCEGPHWLDHCVTFKTKSSDERLDWFKEQRRCFRCTRKSHSSRGCTARYVCSVCKGRHSSVLHEALCGNPQERSRSGNPSEHQSEHPPNRERDKPPTAHKSNNTTTRHGAGTADGNLQSYLMVVPVRLFTSAGLLIDTKCILDTGSQACLITERLASSLKLRGERVKLSMGNVCTDIEPVDSTVYLNKLHICDPRDSFTPPIVLTEVFSFPNFSLPDQSIPRDGDGHPAWPHIRDLDIPDVKGTDIELLIGVSCKEALRELEVREGGGNLPDAVRVPLGWCLRGSQSSIISFDDGKGKVLQNLSISYVEPTIINEPSLNDMIESLWRTESFGCKYSDSQELSHDDRYAKDILEKSVRLLPEGRYEVAMLWTPDFEKLPNNISQSVSKYHSLRRRLLKQPIMFERYRDAMNQNIIKGYATELNDASIISNKTYTLPHHGIWNETKGKMRPVFDAAAKFHGLSLNDHLLSGPDLASNVDAVKLRFREGSVPLCADVEDMFSRVKVPDGDSDALRFLWDPDFGPNPKVYKMLVHIFGAKCSPTCANFALRQCALDNRGKYPEKAVRAILDSCYVDDFLHSVDSESEAVELCQQVINILGSGGFKLTKWVSTSKAVLDAATSTNQNISAIVNLDMDKDSITHRVLGLCWDITSDSFFYASKQPKYAPTKRGMLSEICSVYDPLGFIAPFIIRARILFQRLWQTGIDWDDEIDPQIRKEWHAWCEELVSLSSFSIPRKYWPSTFVATNLQLHVFCDASELAFCSCCYIRASSSEDEQFVSLVMSKTRVTPCRTKLTLPRLELQAAVLGVRLSNMIKNELKIKFDKIQFWTDSLTVIQYIVNDSRRFRPFVGNRVAEIRASSEPNQWFHVAGTENPADDGTRGQSVKDLAGGRWLNGPKFLWLPEESWPRSIFSEPLKSDDPEIKRATHFTKVGVSGDCCIVDTNRTWSWIRLVRIVACVILFIKKCRKLKPRSENIASDDMIEAKNYLYLSAQSQVYHVELHALKCSKPLPTTSNILSLRPFLHNGLLRVGGRLDKALIPYDARHQIILPPDHRITHLIMLDIHNQMCHAAPGTVIAKFREEFWVVRIRSQVLKALSNCMECRNLKAKPQVPLMAPLPQARVDGGHVYQYCGVDYFGPILVKERRNKVSRWVALFTCLTVRCVHLEVVNSLSSDAFINAFIRFFSRYGGTPPAEMYCDNGTNFCGAAPELREGIKRLNTDVIFRDFLVHRGIKFHFIPPRTPHFGGAWERMVGLVKRNLKAILKDRVVCEDVLTTALAQVQACVNSRPLTFVDGDPACEPEPLTPNHFLAPTRSSFQVTPLDVTEPSDENSRKRWRQSQFIADAYWRRWSKEYLAGLTVRQKWQAESRDLQIGDVVILVQDSLPRGLWPLGRVNKVFPGTDGRVRVVEVMTKGTVLTRSAAKVCFLEQTK